VLLLDTDPVMPTDSAVRGALETLAANLAKAGVRIDRSSPRLPDFGA
jgi:amidase